VIVGFDSDLASQAVFFNPIPGNPTDPTTSDPNCVARTAGGSSCSITVTRTRARIQLAEQNDFANVGAAADTVEFHGGPGADRVFTTGSKLQAFGDEGNDESEGLLATCG
jgi:hypothetical protein